MLKDNGKNIIAILVIFILTFFIFIIGVEFFQPNTPYNNPSIINREITQLFNKFINSEGRENWLIPVVALFSGLSAFATVYLIWLQQQTIKKHDLEVETERVISHFFILLDKHRTIVNNFKFPLDHNYSATGEIVDRPNSPENYAAIYYCIQSLDILFSYFGYANTKYYKMICFCSDMKINGIINRIPGICPNNKLSDIEKFEYITLEMFKILDSHTSYIITQYFNNIYIMLQLLVKNKNKINIEEYMRTLRAEFTQSEFILIYYYAFIYKENGRKNFKKLIEDTHFFSELHEELRDCDPKTLDDENYTPGTPFVIYSPSAFKHD